MRDYIELPIDPPEKSHDWQCVEHDYLWYQCPTCGILVDRSETNYCNLDGLFIPVAAECICEEIETSHIQW